MNLCRFALALVAPALLTCACQTTARPAAELTQDGVRAAMSDRTAITGAGATGWQVEYAAPDGRLFVVNPGAEVVMGGTWSVRTASLRNAAGPFSEVQVCYTYADSHGEGPPRLGEEKCVDARYPLGMAGAIRIRSRKGDIFGLTSNGAAALASGPAPAWPR